MIVEGGMSREECEQHLLWSLENDNFMSLDDYMDFVGINGDYGNYKRLYILGYFNTIKKYFDNKKLLKEERKKKINALVLKGFNFITGVLIGIILTCIYNYYTN